MYDLVLSAKQSFPGFFQPGVSLGNSKGLAEVVYSNHLFTPFDRNFGEGYILTLLTI